MQNIEKLLELAKILIAVYGSTAAFIFAVLVLFWGDKRLSHHKSGMIKSFIFIVVSIITLLSGFMLTGTKYYEVALNISIRGSIFISIIGLLFLIYTFLLSYLKILSLRTRRISKYLIPSSVLRHVTNKSYVKRMKERQSFTLFGLEVGEREKEDIGKGYIFLIVADANTEDKVKDAAVKFCVEGLSTGETMDYVCTDNHPYSIKDRIDKCARELKFDLSKLAKDDIVIIDAFSPNYGFKEDILIDRSESTKIEMNIIKAESIAAIHSAAIKAWYAHKKRLKKSTGKALRRPHRMIYDHVSGLSSKYSEEHILEFFTHLISSEKAYGMLTVIIEYSDTKEQILNVLKQLVDCCLIAKLDGEDKNVAFLELTKIKTRSEEITIGKLIEI